MNVASVRGKGTAKGKRNGRKCGTHKRNARNVRKGKKYGKCRGKVLMKNGRNAAKDKSAPRLNVAGARK